jgi:hypothetical protein
VNVSVVTVRPSPWRSEKMVSPLLSTLDPTSVACTGLRAARGNRHHTGRRHGREFGEHEIDVELIAVEHGPRKAERAVVSLSCPVARDAPDLALAVGG